MVIELCLVIELEALFSNKCSHETVYLDSLVKKYETKIRVSIILKMKELFLNITEIKNAATKDMLAIEYHKN